MTIIGAGNMATNLAMSFFRKGVAIRCIYSHTLDNAQALAERVGAVATDNLLSLPTNDDIYIFAVKDAFLRSVIQTVVAHCAEVAEKALFLHTAGSVGIEVFDRLPVSNGAWGVFYPFQTLSKNRVLDFSHIPIFLEASRPNDMLRMKQLAATITDEVYEADSATRTRLHLAGVFANNFANCMYAIGAELLEGTGLSPKVLLSLQDETAAKVHQVAPRQAQTGPARRHDQNVMQHHMNQLPPDLRELYRLISLNIEQHS